MPNARSSLRFADAADGGIVLDLENDLLFSVNSTAGLIVKALERGDSEETMIASICAQTGATPAIVQSDVRDFLGELERHGLRARFAHEGNQEESSS